MKSAAKNSLAYKSNRQINGKEGKGKKRNDSGIAFDGTVLVGKPGEPSVDIYTLKLNA